MAAFNVVRFRVKPGCQQQFIDLHKSLRPAFSGFKGGDLIQTGEQTFCFVGQWRNMDAIAAARPEMIAVLDQVRELLEDLGGDLGVTDPVSGAAVVSVKWSKKKKAKKKANRKQSKKKDKKGKKEKKKRKK